MTRAERLLALVRLLRTYRYPVAGQQLAEALSISLRTLYRDIATLQAQGADIRGEPGLGYVLHPGFVLPPLMFTEHELEALMLGMRWVAQRADPALSQAANDVLAKAEAVLPPGGAWWRRALEPYGVVRTWGSIGRPPRLRSPGLA